MYAGNHLSNLPACSSEKPCVGVIQVWGDSHKTGNTATTELPLLVSRIVSDLYFPRFSTFFLQHIRIIWVINSLKVVLNIYVLKPIDLFLCNFLYCFKQKVFLLGTLPRFLKTFNLNPPGLNFFLQFSTMPIYCLSASHCAGSAGQQSPCPV